MKQWQWCEFVWNWCSAGKAKPIIKLSWNLHCKITTTKAVEKVFTNLSYDDDHMMIQINSIHTGTKQHKKIKFQASVHVCINNLYYFFFFYKSCNKPLFYAYISSIGRQYLLCVIFRFLLSGLMHCEFQASHFCQLANHSIWLSDSLSLWSFPRTADTKVSLIHCHY